MHKSSGEMPLALQNRPVSDDNSEPIADAFRMLYRGEPIPISEIKHYASIFGVADIQRFAILIKQAEMVALKFRDSKHDSTK